MYVQSFGFGTSGSRWRAAARRLGLGSELLQRLSVLCTAMTSAFAPKFQLGKKKRSVPFFDTFFAKILHSGSQDDSQFFLLVLFVQFVTLFKS